MLTEIVRKYLQEIKWHFDKTPGGRKLVQLHFNTTATRSIQGAEIINLSFRRKISVRLTAKTVAQNATSTRSSILPQTREEAAHVTTPSVSGKDLQNHYENWFWFQRHVVAMCRCPAALFRRGYQYDAVIPSRGSVHTNGSLG